MIKTFTIRESDRDHAQAVKREILTYRHVENMLLILIQQQYQTAMASGLVSDKKILHLLLNSIVMKPVLAGIKGGPKTASDVAMIRQHFGQNPLFQSLIQLSSSTQCNDKLCAMVMRNIVKQYKAFFTNIRKGRVASPPSPVKLRNVVRFSLDLDKAKYAYDAKTGKLRLTLTKNKRYVFIGQSPYLTSKTITSMNINVEHGYVYYNIKYEEPAPVVSVPVTQKIAGVDVGMYNLLSLFVGDRTTSSVIIGGRRLLSYNQNVHRRLARLQSDLATLPVHQHARVRRQRAQLFRDRSHFFEDNFRKISKRLIDYLVRHGVTDMVISKNLQFAKTKGQLQGGTNHNQKFYSIPFGDLLNKLEAKAVECGIVVHTIDEAYTSKVSSVQPGLIHQIRAASQTTTKVPGQSRFSPKVCGGTRGKKSTGLGRGQFLEHQHNVVLNADLNAACNHIAVAFPGYRPPIGVWHKWCNPRHIISKRDCESL